MLKTLQSDYNMASLYPCHRRHHLII